MDRREILTVAAAIVAVIVLIAVVAHLRKKQREGFVTEHAKEVYAKSRDMFERNKGAVSFSDYKTQIPTADPVVFTDARKLWREGKLTPESVQGVI